MIADDDPALNLEPDDVGDIGFHYPIDYVTRVCQILKLSHFSYWPRAGGLDEQDSFLIDDVMTWFRLANRLRWEYEEHQWRGPGDQKPKGYNPLIGRQ